MTVASRRRSARWIPPEPLIFAQLAQFVSWLLLFVVGARGEFAASPDGFAWIHVVALGWLTTTALAFLIHILPGFTDAEWRLESLARASLWIYQPGVVALVFGFVTWRPMWLMIGGVVVVASIVAYLAAAAATLLGAANSSDRATRAAVWALGVTLGMLGLTASLGLCLAWALDAGRLSELRWPALHATLGIVGWLGILVLGVSVRTYNRLIGRSARRRVWHIATGSLSWIGLLALALGMAMPVRALALAGGSLLILAGALYSFDTIRSLLAASARHLLPRAFIWASQIWLIVALLCALGILFGNAALGPVYLFAFLMGWIGQAVNAHLSHVGIRLVTTIVLGDDDETPPGALLDARVGFTSLLAYQAALAFGIAGLLLRSATFLEIAAVLGVLGLAAMAANVAIAVANARRSRAFTSSSQVSP